MERSQRIVTQALKLILQSKELTYLDDSSFYNSSCRRNVQS